MIDALLKVSEKFVQLLEYRDKRSKRQYEDFVAPIFVQMRNVHDDYLKMFETALATIRTSNDVLGMVAAFDESRRREEPLRRDLAEQADIFSKGGFDDEAYRAFFTEVENYLRPVIRLMATQSRGVFLKTEIMRLRPARVDSNKTIEESRISTAHPLNLDRSDSTEEIVCLLTRNLDELRQSWINLARAHATAKLVTKA